MFIQETHSTVMPWIGITTHHHLMLLVYGHIQEGEVMKMNFQLIGNLGDMINSSWIHIMRWITSVNTRSIHFRNLINYEMVITVLTPIVILGLRGLQGLGDVIVMIMHMMISTIGPVLPIRPGGTVVKEIMTMVRIVMILIMTEVVGERAAGGVVNLVTVSVTRSA